MVKVLPPLVRTPIYSQLFAPVKTPEPKSIVTVNRPLVTQHGVVGHRPGDGGNVALVLLNSVKVRL